MKNISKFAIVALAAMALAGCKTNLDSAEQQRANMGGLQYAQASGTDFVSCSGIDSDSDGYVTCTVKARAPQTGIAEVTCSYESVGCKRKAS